jgi:hypothetical protein
MENVIIHCMDLIQTVYNIEIKYVLNVIKTILLTLAITVL